MGNLYKVTFEAFVIAEDAEAAEEQAKFLELTIQDKDVKPTSVVQITNNTLIDVAVKFVQGMSNDGFHFSVIENALKNVVKGLGYNLSQDELDAVYKHCEFVYLHNYSE